MTPESRAYLRELARAIKRQEDITDERAQRILYELAFRIYALLLRELPTGRFERIIVWRRLKPQITLLLIAAANELATLLFPILYDTEVALQRIFATFFALPPLPPRLREVVLRTTEVTGTPVDRLFTSSPTTGVSPFTAQLMRLLERNVTAAFFADTPTPQLATDIIRIRTRLGTQTPIAARGTVAYAWRDRFRAITAASLWSLVTPNAERYSPMAATSVSLWRWNAVLDPRTCPICRPLHNTTAPNPSAFPHGAPPVHPRCRCIVIPELTAT